MQLAGVCGQCYVCQSPNQGHINANILDVQRSLLLFNQLRAVIILSDQHVSFICSEQETCSHLGICDSLNLREKEGRFNVNSKG